MLPALDRLVVLGAGAVGASIGGLLFEAGLPVVLVARGAHGQALRRDGLSLRLPERGLRLTIPCVALPSEVTWRPGDVVLWSTKLTDGQAALDDLRAAAGPQVPVVCAVNGVQGEDWARARFEQVLSMLVWLPATHLVPGEVRLHASGCLGVLDTGPATPLAEELCARLRSAGFDALARDDIERWKRAKWITNLGGAAQALHPSDWRALAKTAQAEGEAVLDAAGLARVPTAELLERVSAVRVAPVDGARRQGGSTWQSHALGKPMETAYLEGAMAALAHEVGVPAPVNASLAEAASAPREPR